MVVVETLTIEKLSVMGRDTYRVASTAQLMGLGTDFDDDDDDEFRGYDTTEHCLMSGALPNVEVTQAEATKSAHLGDYIVEKSSDCLQPPATPENQRSLRRITTRISSKSSGSASSSSSREIDIYFSPIDVNRSRIELSSPMTSPCTTPTQDTCEASLNTSEASPQQTPTQETYNKAKWLRGLSPPAAPRQYRKHLVRPSEGKLRLTPSQIDLLVTALVKCPMMQRHVRTQWWDDNNSETADDASTRSLSPPNTEVEFEGITKPVDTDASMTDLLAQLNDPFMSDDTSLEVPEETPIPKFPEPSVRKKFSKVSEEDTTPIPHAVLLREYEQSFARHPDVLKAPRHTVKSMIVANSEEEHAPVCSTARTHAGDYQVGEYSHLDMAKGKPVVCSLRLDAPERAKGESRDRVILQVHCSVLGRKSGIRERILAVDFDVTESFTKAALMEVLSHAAKQKNAFREIDTLSLASKVSILSLQEASVPDSNGDTDYTYKNAAVDTWDDFVHQIADDLASLTKETCTMQTLTLMSTLKRLQDQHQDFMLVQGSEFQEEYPTQVRVPWHSQRLEQRTWGEAEMTQESANEFRVELIHAIADGFQHAEPQVVEMKLLGIWGRVYCVPLADEVEGKTAGWICFLRSQYDI